MGRITLDGFDLRQLVRPAMFIPATSSLGGALRQMQAARLHFVFVIDEHGGLEGILTLEDLLEEIVGEINDEYDKEAREQIRKDGAAYVLDGMLSVRDANQYLELDIPEDDGYTTIAGFLMDRAGRILTTEDKVEHDNGVFEIERVDGRRITRIRFVPRSLKRKADKITELRSLLGVSIMAGQTATTLEVGVVPLLSCV